MLRMLSELEFRKNMQMTLDLIEKAFLAADVDPDVAECVQALGSMTLTFADQSRCILSAQPSVRQLWLALASKGKAHHFNWNESTKTWVDDKEKQIELLGFLDQVLKDAAGLSLSLKAQSDPRVFVYTTTYCPYCVRAKELLVRRGIAYKEVQITDEDDEAWDALFKRSGMKTVPQIFVDGTVLGGFTELAAQDQKDQLSGLK